MYPIEIEYTATTKDFREAYYFATIERLRTSFRILAALIIATVLYLFIVALKITPLFGPILLIPAGYVVWALIVFGNTELKISKYMKSPDCMLGKTYRAVFTDSRLDVDIVDLKQHNSCIIAKLPYVVELTDIYMVYLTIDQLYIIPKRQLTVDQKNTIQKSFRKHLGDRYYSVNRRKKKEPVIPRKL